MPDTPRHKVTRARMVFSSVLLLIILLGSAYVFGYRGVRFFLVPTSSMVPTLYPRDYMITVREHEYLRGDIVVLDDPTDPGSYLVKRVVGLPGDTLMVDAGALFINDTYISEPYLNEEMFYTLSPVTLPPDQIFVLGDNRNASDDSVVWLEKGHGTLLNSIKGRVVYIYSPLSRLGPVPRYTLILP